MFRKLKADLLINGRSTKEFKDTDWDAYRNNSIGFIFQSYNLINHLDVISNVEMGMTLSGVSKKEKRIFTAETFIIGISSGILGLFIAWALTVPINQVIYNMSELENVARLNPLHALALLTVSVGLTLLGGMIPSKYAAKKTQ